MVLLRFLHFVTLNILIKVMESDAFNAKETPGTGGLDLEVSESLP